LMTEPELAIQFYGQPPAPNRYTNTNIYYLTVSHRLESFRRRDPVRLRDEREEINTFRFRPDEADNDFYRETAKIERNEAYWPEFKQQITQIKPQTSPDVTSEITQTEQSPARSGINSVPTKVGIETEHWFFVDELFAPSSTDISFNLDHLAKAAEPAELKLALQGGSTLNGMKPAYQKVNIYLNGQPLGAAEWSGDTAYLFTVQVSPDLLREGENFLTIELPDEKATIQQFVLIDYLEIVYPREFVPRGNQISFTALSDGRQTYKISGFSSNLVEGWVVRNPTTSPMPTRRSEAGWESGQAGRAASNKIEHLEINAFQVGTEYNVIFFDDAQPGDHYFILPGNLIKKPLSLRTSSDADLKNRENQADYIIIAPEKLMSGLQPLVAHRTKDGLLVKTVAVEDIYDEFNYGLFSPVAIKEFLKYAYENWRRPALNLNEANGSGTAPQYVLLVGDGTYDYKDYWETGEFHPVPAYLMATDDMGETVSDHWFGNIDADILPEMIIGRIPANDLPELSAVVNKIIAYETVGQRSKKRGLFVADTGDAFQSGSEYLAGIVPPDYEKVKLYLNESESWPVRQGIIDTTNQGVGLINFLGHGGVGLWSSQGVLTNNDIGQFNNKDKYPIMMAWNCLSGYFTWPGGMGMDSLTERFIRAPDKGIIAAIAPTGLSSSTEQLVLAEGLYQAIFSPDNKRPIRLGDAYYQAMEYLVKNQSLIGST
ncbi:MAG: C25 family cysteine peptidase, partial [Planctomycetota bacterium]